MPLKGAHKVAGIYTLSYLVYPIGNTGDPVFYGIKHIFLIFDCEYYWKAAEMGGFFV